MVYSLQIDNAAFKIFHKLPKDVQEKMLGEAEILKTNPLVGEPLKGKYKFLRSLHFSFKGTAYRVVYQVFSQTSTVMVRLATTRENIYRRLDQMKIKPVP
jgi:mRNA-degrading endonuclease RelE of RelBE toxin-antitoxin system